MDLYELPQDFKEFLRLLNAEEVEYLIVGGFAVSYHGFPRPTGDLDLWVAMTPENAGKLVKVFKDFGFNVPNLREELFLKPDQIVSVGNPPVRIEVIMTISGVEFPECYQRKVSDLIDGVEVNIISVDDLKTNKRASGRHKDLADLDELP